MLPTHAGLPTLKFPTGMPKYVLSEDFTLEVRASKSGQHQVAKDCNKKYNVREVMWGEE